MADLFSKLLNMLVLVGLCAVGYVCIKHYASPSSRQKIPGFSRQWSIGRVRCW